MGGIERAEGLAGGGGMSMPATSIRAKCWWKRRTFSQLPGVLLDYKLAGQIGSECKGMNPAS